MKITKDKNCPNCGAPYLSFENTCPYCGTSYFDLSCIDFTDGKPIYLKLKVPIGNNKVLMITQKCFPRLGSINMSSDTNYITDSLGNTIKSFVSNNHITTDMSFEGICDSTSNYLVVEEEE